MKVLETLLCGVRIIHHLLLSFLVFTDYEVSSKANHPKFQAFSQKRVIVQKMSFIYEITSVAFF
jgi:hypothetical protein